MGPHDYERVVEEMRLERGLPWALPVCLAVERAPHGDEVALTDESGRPVAVLEVDQAYEYDKEREAERCFRTTDEAHPGVARLFAQKPMYLGGRVTVFERAEPAFPELALDPAQTRATFAERGWKRVVGFQTRNPIHRAHEYLTKGALETVDGLLIHPLVGDTKADDVPAATRVACYRILVENYYPADRVLVSAFPAAMRYAGPREAIWHAICRKNYGCSHFIVGRDHAGVGSYYGTYDAHHIFRAFQPRELGITPLFFDHAFYCQQCEGMASTRTCPHGADAGRRFRSEVGLKQAQDRTEDIEIRHAEFPAFRLQPLQKLWIEQGVEHDAGRGFYLVEHPVELSLAADQRVNVLDRRHGDVLGGRRTGDGDQRLAGRIRNEMEVEIASGTVRHAKPGKRCG